MWIERGEGERERERERERVRVRTREKERSVRCEVTGRSRGPTFVSRTFLVCPLRTRARTYVCTYVDGAWMCWHLEGAGEPEGRGGMRETFSSVPTARRLPLRSSLLALLLPSVGHTGARVRPRTPNTPARSHIYPFQRGSRVYIHCTRAIPPPKNCSCRGGVGRAATPLDRLRCCEARQRAISGRPYPSEDEEGGVLLSKRVCVRCVANVRTYEWVYVATCARVRCVVEPLIARGKGEKRRFLCSLFVETRDTGILESVKGAVCVRSNRRKKVVSILRWIFCEFQRHSMHRGYSWCRESI